MKLKGLDYLDISSNFSDDEVMIQHSVREFVDNEVMPIIDEHFKNATFPNELIPQFADMNLLGVNLPKSTTAAGCHMWPMDLFVRSLRDVTLEFVHLYRFRDRW